MRRLAIALVVMSAAPALAAADPAAANAAAADPRAATRKAAHEVLAKNCGECHEGHRSKNAKALAVYDLDKPDWPSRFIDDHIGESALRRLSKRPAPAREVFLAFREAERTAAAAPSR
jgi:predicted CXXCH cytochrome family protein